MMANNGSGWEVQGTYEYTISAVTLHYRKNGSSVEWIISREAEGNIWIFPDFFFTIPIGIH
jgi:hypothetical protein